MKFIFTILLNLWCMALISHSALATEHDAASKILFNNVNIFDGKKNRLQNSMNVLVVDNKIEKISELPIGVQDGARVVNGNGRTLMPGLIDAHAHVANVGHKEMEMDYDKGDVGIMSSVKALDYLMDGFTSIRDVGGPAFPVRRAIDGGHVPGPRIYPSGAFISQTSGHGDLRHYNDPNPTLTGIVSSNRERMGYTTVVDGRARVLAAVRQNLMQGATQIKIMGGGGGASKYDPIDVTQFTEDEIRAAVEAADDWGTYVTAHVFTSKAIKRLIGAGLKCVEHAFFADEETIKLIARKGVFVSTQTWGLSPRLFEHPSVVKEKHASIRRAHANAQNFVPWLMKHKVKVAFGTDGIGLEGGQKSRRYELHWRAQMFGSNFEVLKQATSVAAELLALSGPRNPYPGKLGVVEEGAYADLLLVDGNPLSDLSVLGATEQWFDAPTPGPIDTLHMVMKDGVIYKDKM